MGKRIKHSITNHQSPCLAGRQAFTPKGAGIHYSLLFTFYFLLFNACTPDPPPTLSYKDRQMVDSLFRIQVDSLKPLLDSLCDMRFDSAVQRTVDSIIEERKSEKEKYLERLKRDLKKEK